MLCRVFLPFWLGLFAWLPLHAAPISDSQLLKSLEAAVKTKDKSTIMRLYNWKGVPDWVKADQSDDIDDWLTRELKSGNLSPLSTNFHSSGTQGNLRFHLNLQPAGIIELHFTDGYGIGFAYGKKGNAFYLAGVIIEEIATPHDKTNCVIIRVESPDGRPLRHAWVHSVSGGDAPWLHFTRILGGDFVTDGQGQLHLPLTDTKNIIVVANRRGFGVLRAGELTNQAALIVQPWGHIEGILKNRNTILTNFQLELTLDRNFYWVKEMPPVRLMGETIPTDAQGRFAFDAVPPLKLVLNIHDNQTPFGTYLCSASASPGETNHLKIDVGGRTVTGRVIKGKGVGSDLDLTNCLAFLSSTVKTPEGEQRNIYFQVSNGGTFHANLVEPGDYKISGNIPDKDRTLDFLEPIVVHVPDEASDAPDKPIDMGTVTVEAALKPGAFAPDFTVSDLDGKSFKLSDYRGKYVLLDFWATWCGPCVRETPNMKAAYDAFGKDKRFAIISLSLDSDPAAPRKFARSRDTPWKQGFLGDMSSDKVTGTYGVSGIPAIFLIGPDGKIVARDLRGGKIKEAVTSALAN